MSETLEVKITGMGAGKTFKIIEIMVSVGDNISKGQAMITLESEKASVEITSEYDGIVQEILVNIGDNVYDGISILKLETLLRKKNSIDDEIKSDIIIEKDNLETINDVDKDEHIKVLPSNNVVEYHATPLVRKFARELGVDISLVHGTGQKDRITLDDIKSFVRINLQGNINISKNYTNNEHNTLNVTPLPKVNFEEFGLIEYKELSRIRKLAKSNLHRNWISIPHVTNHDEADISELERMRIILNQEYKRDNIKITMLSFIVKVVVTALKEIPEFNSSIDGDNLILKKYFNIGFAVDTPQGLIVPVIRNADKKGIIEITLEISNLSKKARDGKLTSDDIKGGCFSISSLGGIGGSYFTPIINAPEVAILGVSKSYNKPLWDGEKFIPRLMLPLSLSYDHRVIDGAMAARFNVLLCKLLSDFRRVIL